MKTNYLESIKKALGGKAWLLLIALLGVVLLLVSGGASQGKNTERTALDTEAYRTSLEGSVKAMCEQMQGVGKATVLITFSGGERAVYEKNKSETGESVALSGGDALLVGYAYPEISGVAVVCDGGGEEAVKARLTLLLSAALSVPTTKIYIAPSN